MVVIGMGSLPRGPSTGSGASLSRPWSSGAPASALTAVKRRQAPGGRERRGPSRGPPISPDRPGQGRATPSSSPSFETASRRRRWRVVGELTSSRAASSSRSVSLRVRSRVARHQARSRPRRGRRGLGGVDRSGPPPARPRRPRHRRAPWWRGRPARVEVATACTRGAQCLAPPSAVVIAVVSAPGAERRWTPGPRSRRPARPPGSRPAAPGHGAAPRPCPPPWPSRCP